MIRFFLKDHINKEHIFLIKTKDQKTPENLDPIIKVINIPAIKDDMVTVLETLENQGIDFPYSCRAGACTTCCCGILKGKDNLNQKKAGEPIIDLEADEFLTCIGGFDDEKVKANEIFDVHLESKNM